MRETEDIKLADLRNQLITLEHRLAQQEDQIDKCANTVMNLSQIYHKANAAGRLQFLKAIFPSGFDIKKPDYSVRT